jgi:hypothetical protein
VLRNILVVFQRLRFIVGNYMQHTRDIVAADPDDDDADPALDCGHEVMAKALAATEPLIRRPRLLQAEFHHAWIRAVVSSEMGADGKKDAAIFAAQGHLEVSERTVRNAIAPAPAAPELDRERLLRILAANIRIAEESGNQRAADFLRRYLDRTRATF